MVTEYSEDQLELVLEACERMNAHLTAAVVSNDPLFLQASWFCSLFGMFTFIFIYFLCYMLLLISGIETFSRVTVDDQTLQ